MQPSSPELERAILARDATSRPEARRPYLELLMDWRQDGYDGPGSLDDLSARVKSMTITREVVTDLPADVRRAVSGSTSATLEATLAGPGGRDPAPRWWSPTHQGSPYYGLEREARPVRARLGFRTDAGPEALTLLEGRSRTVALDPPAGTVTLAALDGSEQWRSPSRLPQVLANDHAVNDDGVPTGGLRPGLDNTWCVDYIARAKGSYASPPPRPGAGIVATMHGSAYPERGRLLRCWALAAEPAFFEPFKWNLGLRHYGDPRDVYEYYSVSHAWRMAPTRRIAMECWARLEDTGQDRGLMSLNDGTTGFGLRCSATGDVGVYLKTPNGGAHVLTSTLNVADGNSHYIAAYANFGADTAYVIIRVDGQQETLTPTGFVNGGAQPDLDVLQVGRGLVDGTGVYSPWYGHISDVQVSEYEIQNEWNDAFEPTAEIWPSLNMLHATPVSFARDAWDVLQEIAESELAVALMDERGRFKYLTRQALDFPAYADPVRTLTTRDSISRIRSAARSIDTIRNRVQARVQPIVGQPAIDVWSLAEKIPLAPNSDRVLCAKHDQPAYNIDLTVLYAGDGPGQVTGSRYRAGRDEYGGDVVFNIGFDVQPEGDITIITVNNPNPYWVWIVQPDGIPFVEVGSPSFVLHGQPGTTQTVSGGSVVTTAGYVNIWDQPSIDEYGEKLLLLPDNPWRQFEDSVRATCEYLLEKLKTSTLVLGDVEIVGDPRLQLLDVVRLQDPDGLALDTTCRITRLETEKGAGEQGIVRQTIAAWQT